MDLAIEFRVVVVIDNLKVLGFDHVEPVPGVPRVEVGIETDDVLLQLPLVKNGDVEVVVDYFRRVFRVVHGGVFHVL